MISEKDIINLNFEEYPVRTISESPDTTLFQLKDVCEILEIKNHKDVLKRLDKDEKAEVDTIYPSSNGVKQRRRVWFITEEGLYSVIIESRSDKAKAFKRWICHEVLPSIRRRGFYSTADDQALFTELVKEMEYDHFFEDVFVPALEAQNEFTLKELIEHYVGFEMRTKEDYQKAQRIWKLNAKDRKLWIEGFKHNVVEHQEKDFAPQMFRFQWNYKENKGHSKVICGVRYFDDFIMDKLQKGQSR